MAHGSLLTRVAVSRGISGEALNGFLEPKRGDLVHPRELFGAVAVGERLAAALRTGKKIAIFGDYDADGMCAAAILLHWMRALRPEDPPMVYIPNRATDGYGLSARAVEQLHQQGVHTIVSVDCGITAIDEASQARRLGLELLITDHHRPRADGQLPNVDAIAHPALHGASGELCGAAVAWKVGWAMAIACSTEKLTPPLRELFIETLALAAIGTVADVMPLVGENRTIARLGSARIANSTLPGVRTLAREAGIGQRDRVDAERISFGIAPILNACGRLGDPSLAVELLGLPAHPPIELKGRDEQRAKELAAKFTRLNEDRKEIERGIVDAALVQWETSGIAGSAACVLWSPDWRRGVVGVACARLVEKLRVPVVLLEQDGAVAYGSSRSVDGYSVLEGLQACSAHLLRFGGHDAAAGVSIRVDRLPAFREAFTAHAASHRGTSAPPTLRPDVELFGTDLTVKSLEELETLGPFGRGFRAPRVLVRDAMVSSDPRPFGADGDHLSFFVRIGDLSGPEVRCTWWRQACHAGELSRGMQVQLIATPQVDRWKSAPRCALTLLDVSINPPG